MVRKIKRLLSNGATHLTVGGWTGQPMFHLLLQQQLGMSTKNCLSKPCLTVIVFRIPLLLGHILGKKLYFLWKLECPFVKYNLIHDFNDHRFMNESKIVEQDVA